MNIFLRWLINATAIIIAAYIIPGVIVSSLWTAFILALVLGLLNITLRPILLLLTLPINFITLGLFTLVINSLIILLASTIIKGFYIDGFLPALLFSIVLMLLQNLFFSMSHKEKQQKSSSHKKIDRSNVIDL